MTDDGFVIIETAPRPKPRAKPKPLIAADQGRTFADLSNEQKARVNRRQQGPIFCEPTYDNNGPTGRWRVGRIIGSTEETTSEAGNKDEAMEIFRRLVTEFYGRG